MSLLTYEAARPWAKSIKEAVLTRRMPPWFADRGIGHFSNERSLTETEIKTLVEWVDGGAPEGNSAARPAPVKWVDGWNIKPNVIYGMPEPYTVPKEGILEYIYILLPAKFPTDTWVLNGEIHPSDRSVVHHASVVVRPPGSKWMKSAKPGVPYEPTAQDRAESTEPFYWLFGYAPGVSPEGHFSPQEDAGRFIPAGSDLFLEMHYTVNGKESQDQTQLGLVLSNKRPARQLLNLIVTDNRFEIPPNAPNYGYSTSVLLDEPITLLYLQPHLHLRGIDMKIDVTYPDGRSETLLSVPRYNFMWQVIYMLAKPVKLPKGTRVLVSAHWDNSPNNKFNPDPSKTVRWGAQTGEEMLVALLGAVVEVNPDRYRKPGQMSSASR
jgi:hypothetical protein